MTFEVKLKLKKFREVEAKLFDYRGIKNNVVATQAELELMLQIIKQLEGEIFNIEMWRDR